MLFACAIFLATRIGTEFMPPLNEGDLMFMPVTDPGDLDGRSAQDQ